MTDSTYSWSKGMRADSIQLSNRLQTIIRFQIANDLQIFLNQILAPHMQLLAMFILIVCTELSVRRLNMYSFASIRAVVVIKTFEPQRTGATIRNVQVCEAILRAKSALDRRNNPKR